MHQYRVRFIMCIGTKSTLTNKVECVAGVFMSVARNTVDPRVTTGLTYEKLGLRQKNFVLTYDQSLELRPAWCP
jgi:hypothetical protein